MKVLNPRANVKKKSNDGEILKVKNRIVFEPIGEIYNEVRIKVSDLDEFIDYDNGFASKENSMYLGNILHLCVLNDRVKAGSGYDLLEVYQDSLREKDISHIYKQIQVFEDAQELLACELPIEVWCECGEFLVKIIGKADGIYIANGEKICIELKNYSNTPTIGELQKKRQLFINSYIIGADRYEWWFTSSNKPIIHPIPMPIGSDAIFENIIKEYLLTNYDYQW